MLITIACGSPSYTDEGRPTPDVEGTVEAKVQATIAAMPSPTPDLALERIKRTHLTEELLKEIPRGSLYGQDSSERAMATFGEHYVPIYMASACLEDQEPSAQGFKDFTVRWFARDVSPEPKALTTIQEIREQISIGVPPGKLCLQSYVAPGSVGDAGLAVDLYRAAVLRSIPVAFRTGLESVIQRHARKWFETDRQQPFIIFLCEESSRFLEQEC